jgi:RNA polymerase sigma factor (sigma-70 family)
MISPSELGYNQTARDELPTQREIDDDEIEHLLGVSLPLEQKLNANKERGLLQRIQKGDPSAEQEYITLRAKIIYSAITDFAELSGNTTEDYFWIGCEAVLDFARRFDIDNSRSKPSHLLLRKIKAAIHNAIKTQRLVHPFIILETGDIQIRTGWKEPESIVSLSDLDYTGGEDELLEQTARKFAAQTLREIVGRLPSREKRVLEMRFGLTGHPKTLREVGIGYDITHEGVRKIQNKAIKDLEQEPKVQALRDLNSDPHAKVDTSEVYQARRNQEVAAKTDLDRRYEYERRRAAENHLIDHYSQSGEEASRIDKVVTGLTNAVAIVLDKIENDKQARLIPLPILWMRVRASLPNGYFLRYDDFIRSLNNLSNQGRIEWAIDLQSDAYFIISVRE